MKKIIKWIFAALLAVFVAAIVIRIFQAESTGALSDVLPTDNAKKAYAEGEVFYSHDVDQERSSDGAIMAYSLVYIKDEGEIQITVRHNKSIYERLKIKDGTKFGFKIYNASTEKEFEAYEEKTESDKMYVCHRVAFKDVEFSENEELELVMSSADFGVDYSVLKLHSAEQKFEEYSLSKGEIAELGK